MTQIGTNWTTIGQADDGRFHLKYQAYYSTQDVANNRTYVYRRLLLTVDTYGAISAVNYEFSGTNLTTASGGSISYSAGDHVLTSGEGYVSHASDGSWSQTVTGTANFGGMYIWTANGTATLPTIPRTSKPTVSTIQTNIGNSVTIDMNRASSSFTHDITAKFGSSSTVHNIATNVGDSYIFNSTNYVADLVSAQSSGKTRIVFTVTTKHGTNIIGSAECTLNIVINPSVPTLDKSSVNTGVNAILSTNRTTTARTHKVVATIGSETILTETEVTASYTFNTTTYRTQIMQACGTTEKSCKVVFVVTTYLSGTSIGSRSVTLTVNVNTDAYKPTISFGTMTDRNTATSPYRASDEMIEGLSNLRQVITFGVSSIYELLDSAKVTIGGKTYNPTVDGESSVTYNLDVNAVTSDTITVTATDKRGTTVTATKTFTLVPYSAPVINGASLTRTEMTGGEIKFAISGTAYAYTYTGSSSKTNALTINYSAVNVADSTDTKTGSYTVALSGEGKKGWSKSATFSQEFPYENQYDITFTVSDIFKSTQTIIRLYNGIPVYGWAQEHFDVYGDLHLHERNEPSIVTHISPQNFINRIHGFSDGGENLGIFACVSSWLKHNSNLYYGNDGNPNSFNRANGVNTMVTSINSSTVQDGKYPLDCMSFVMMCLMGIGYEQSIYGDKSNRPNYGKSPINFMSDDVCRFIKYLANGNTRAFPETATWERVLSWQFAMYCNAVGMYHHIDMPTSASSDESLKKARIDVMNGLKAGDILFEGDPNNSSYNTRFESIYHVVIYIGSTRFGDPLVAECSSDGSYPVKVRWRTIGNFKLVGYARIPVGNNIRQSMYDFAAISNAPNAVEQVAMLNRPVQTWDTFKVTVACTYKTASAVGSFFPAIKIGSYVYSRYDENNMPAPTVGEPMLLDMYVCASPFLSSVGSDIQTLTAGYYGASTPTASQATIEIVSVKSIISAEQVGTKDVYIPSTVGASATSITAFVTAVAEYLSDHAVNNFACTFRTAYSGNAYDGYFAKTNASNVLVVLSNLARHGAVYDKTAGGTPTVTTYSSQEIDWNLTSLTLR